MHLALVLAAFVLLAASLQEPTRKIARSLEDARSIYTLATDIEPFGPFGNVKRSAEEYMAHSGQELKEASRLSLK